jgi:hypothetical protein
MATEDELPVARILRGRRIVTLNFGRAEIRTTADEALGSMSERFDGMHAKNGRPMDHWRIRQRGGPVSIKAGAVTAGTSGQERLGLAASR